MDGSSASREAFYDELAEEQLGPLWERLTGLVPAEPRPNAQPYAWHYASVRPRLMEAGRMISAQEAERRVLVLDNPGIEGGSRITDTLYVGLQLILPGETAPPHRHTQSALRFVLEGSGAFTTVDGESTTMHPGDFIITPSWRWHEHGSEADGPVVWLDGLDVPLVSHLGVGFREEEHEAPALNKRPEGWSEARFGAGLLPVRSEPTTTSPIFNYPYERSCEALHRMALGSDLDPHLGHALEFTNPTTGGPAMPTIAAGLRLLPKGFGTRPVRSTDGAVAVVVEGHVKASVGDHKFDLAPRDVLAVPLWTSYSFEATEDSVIFVFSDRPVHQKLGLWREERT